MPDRATVVLCLSFPVFWFALLSPIIGTFPLLIALAVFWEAAFPLAARFRYGVATWFLLGVGLLVWRVW